MPSTEVQKGRIVSSQSPKHDFQLPCLVGEPLMDDASIRDFNGGIGCHIASALEQTLLLSKDMVELRGFRRSEVFLHTKRFLGMVCTYSPFMFFSFFFFFI